MTGIIKAISEFVVKYHIYSYLMKKEKEDNLKISIYNRLKLEYISLMISHSLIYPLEIVKTRIALFNHNYKGIKDCIF